MFGEEYLKYRHFLMINSFAYVKVFVREGWMNRDTGKKGDPRMQFNMIMMLQDVMETFAKKLTIKLDISQLKEESILDLKDTLVSHKGDHPLSFVVYEMEEQIKVNMTCRKQKIQISSELLLQLNEKDVHYKLN
jgi:DNA polymerase-3 subunit alpha